VLLLGSCVSPCPSSALLCGFNIKGALSKLWEELLTAKWTSVVLNSPWSERKTKYPCTKCHSKSLIGLPWVTCLSPGQIIVGRGIGIMTVWIGVTCPLLKEGIGRNSVIAIQPGGGAVPLANMRCWTCKNRSYPPSINGNPLQNA